MTSEDLKKELADIEARMMQADFWNDKDAAQEAIARMQDIKDELAGFGKYDKGSAIMTIFAGAGGDDAEDFVRMLYEMYAKYIDQKGWTPLLVSQHPTDHGGYRNISIEIGGKGVFGRLKHESGVHRLVRVSPFNAQSKRHTSFAMVEVIPKLPDPKDFELPEDEVKLEFTKSSGPGGQNVNKRETAVRATHEPTGITVHAESERTQERNRDRALELLRGKLAAKQEEDRIKKEAGLAVSKTTDNEWGSQIRSYVLHPYQMVKDHRSEYEERAVNRVLEDGDLDPFIDAMAQGDSTPK